MPTPRPCGSLPKVFFQSAAAVQRRTPSASPMWPPRRELAVSALAGIAEDFYTHDELVDLHPAFYRRGTRLRLRTRRPSMIRSTSIASASQSIR